MSIDKIRQALEIIAGKRQCIDNTLSNQAIAEQALAALDAMQSPDLGKLKRTPPAEIISANDVGEDNYTNGWNDAIDRCIALLGIPEGWQKIETAPERELLLVRLEAKDKSWSEYSLEGKDLSLKDNEAIGHVQTHWMPLPAAPQGETR